VRLVADSLERIFPAMVNPPEASQPRPGARKLRAFRAITVGLLACAGAVGLEGVLRWRAADIARSDQLDAGMIQYDTDLGWKLTPGWSGHHHHHDFAARYSINTLGWRNDAPMPVGGRGQELTMIVGDSFTFGLGVDDDVTFVHRLHAAQPPHTWYANGSVPGYSTDQQALLIEKRILPLRPGHVVLVVYLGNDLFDNLRAMPLQLRTRKPYFELANGGLMLRGSPVPLTQDPPPVPPFGLPGAVWGADPSSWPWRARLEMRSEALRIASQALLPHANHKGEFAERFAPAGRLFEAILRRLVTACGSSGVRLTVVTLGGRSFVREPGSISAQYQEVFREQVLAAATSVGVPVVDVARLMQERHRQEGREWFFPNDGHLNPEGHQIVAEILQAEFRP
jgi:lysophospholipase L1-like esterase